jgi:hypothetical protein
MPVTVLSCCLRWSDSTPSMATPSTFWKPTSSTISTGAQRKFYWLICGLTPVSASGLWEMSCSKVKGKRINRRPSSRAPGWLALSMQYCLCRKYNEKFYNRILTWLAIDASYRVGSVVRVMEVATHPKLTSRSTRKLIVHLCRGKLEKATAS